MLGLVPLNYLTRLLARFLLKSQLEFVLLNMQIQSAALRTLNLQSQIYQHTASTDLPTKINQTGTLASQQIDLFS